MTDRVDWGDVASEPESPGSVSSPLAESPPRSAPQQQPPTLSPPPQSNSPAMTKSSTPLGNINAARRPPQPTPTLSSRGNSILTSDLQARVAAFHLGRQNAAAKPPPSPQAPRMGPPGGIPSNFQLPAGMARPQPSPSPSMATGMKSSLAQKRGMALPGGLPGAGVGGKKKPGLSLSQMNNGTGPDGTNGQPGDSNEAAGGSQGSLLDKYSDYIDAKTGSLMFKGRARLTNQGIEFTSGKTFSISLDEVDTLDEMGKGNYGTVYKVRHSRPKLRRPGLGLAGNKAPPGFDSNKEEDKQGAKAAANTSGVVMAMKEIRLELDESKFAAIIMELDILHRCISPFIVDFYGAFFQEGAVYICMEFMDGGSVDKVYAEGIPEGVLRKITLSTTMGLKTLKDDHNIIHRDVKPTNILINTKGQVKICDFGVSGNLVASIAKTNIGCQSYMAPERISSGGIPQAGANPGGGTYSVQSDIWSLGLTIIECALGRYPYPPETYDNIFSQLSAIVDGEPPDLPADRYSEEARDFVRGCLMKIPKLRPTYAMLLQHPWLAPLLQPPTMAEPGSDGKQSTAANGPRLLHGRGAEAGDDLANATEDEEVATWVKEAIERRRSGATRLPKAPALHAAPLDGVTSPSS